MRRFIHVQVKYVVELARALAATAGVHRVDLLTRQISCPDVDWTYGEPVEMITHQADDGDGSGGAYIVRLPCGPRDKYLPKESLWPHIPEFVDRALAHVTNVARALGDQQQQQPDAGAGAPVWPYVVHGHYADAAEAAAHLASALNVPMVMTGHSLGRNKLEQLLKLGRMPRAEIQGTYRIARRIEAEETGLDAADMVVTSTKQEIEEQWGLYDGFDLMVERKLRVRRRRGLSCLGRYMPRMVVIPPGMDFSYVDTQDLAEGDADLQMLMSPGKAKKPLPPIWSEVRTHGSSVSSGWNGIQHDLLCFVLFAGPEVLRQPAQAHDPGAVAAGPQEERHHAAQGLWREPPPPRACQPCKDKNPACQSVMILTQLLMS